MIRTTMVALALALGGCATSPRPATPAAANNAAPPACVTASRLPQSNCATGSSYTQQDINSTGQQGSNMGTALRMLDPSVH